MATGLPSRNILPKGNGMDFHLQYEGKAPLQSILATKPARLDRVLWVEGSPQNRLIYGDCLTVMRALLDDSEIAGKVRLIYIDPPYATRSRFESRRQQHAYEDTLYGAHYLEFLRQRLVLMRELLAEDGSIYVHLDDNMAFPVKVLMDEVFGYRNFRNWITRKKCNPKNYTRKQYGNVADYIMFYTKSDRYVWNQPFEPWDEESARREYPYVEEGTGRRYKKVPVHAPGTRNGATGQRWRGMLPPPGKHWQYTPARLDEMDARGEIYWSPSGNPRRKVYLEDSRGIPVQDIWLDYKDAHNQNIRITGYPTEKNLDMLKRIILASSNSGDLVLDAFAGSGTTAAAAEELGRQWIAIDNSLLALDTMVRRLANGTQPMGDFVNRNNDKAKEEPLFKNRGFHGGIEVLRERSNSLDPLPEATINEWRRLMASG